MRRSSSTTPLTYAGNLDNLEGVMDTDRCVFVEGDICDRDKVRGAFETHQPDVIYNLAAESHVDRSIDGPRRLCTDQRCGDV